MKALATPLALVAGLLIAAPTHAGSQVCGFYVFGGAYPSENQAINKAASLPGSPVTGSAMALDLRTSNSPNAHKALFVVALGPFDTKSEANVWVANWKRSGSPSAYTAHRCFTGV